MKLYEVRTEITNGDGFSDYFYSLTDAKKKAEYILNHLTENEKKNHEITIVGYELSLENYTRTAEQLVNDLFNGDVECDEFDSCFWFKDSARIYEEELK